MRTNKKTLALVLAAMMVASTVAGCASQASSSSAASSSAASGSAASSEASSGASSEAEDDGYYYRFGDGSITIRMMKADKGSVIKDDSPIQEEINKVTGLNIEMLLFPNDELANKVNTMSASNDLPDIVNYSDYYPYAQQGMLLDIEDLVNEYGSNLKTYLSEDLWGYTTYQGTLYAIPYMNDAGKHVISVRGDWLDKLGLKSPTTLDEMYEVAVAFATQDPDGNGIADTYGFSTLTDMMPVYGAYGIPPQGHSSYYVDGDEFWPTMVCPNYKEVLSYMNKLWTAGAIHPDIWIYASNEDERRMQIAQGKIGMGTNWWSIITSIVIQQLGFDELHPEGRWDYVAPIEGPGGPLGNKGMSSQGLYQGCTWLDHDTKYPVECMQLLDWMITDEGHYLCGYGIEGVHYNFDENNIPVATEAGVAARDEKWRDVMSQVMGRRCDLENAYLRLPTDDIYETRRRASILTGLEGYPLYENAVLGLPSTEAKLTYDADLDNFEKDSRIAFITGERSLDEYDAYVQEWLDRGGMAVLDAEIEQYNSLKGTNLVNPFAA